MCLFSIYKLVTGLFINRQESLQERYDATTLEPQHSRLCLVTNLTVLEESNRYSHASTR
jgi:hypothetical protein